MTCLEILLNNKKIVFLSFLTCAFIASTVVLAVLYVSELNSPVVTKTTSKPIYSTLSTTTEGSTTTQRSTTTSIQSAEPTQSVSSTTPSTLPDQDDWRIPKGLFIPLEYNLTLYPNLTQEYFTGEIRISFNVTEKLSYVKINTKGLDIMSILINGLFYLDSTIINYEIMKLEIKKLINELDPKRTHTLHIEFRGSMESRNVGLYTSNYIDEDEKKRYIVASNFEPTYARQTFPCFDEPNYKAQFTVHIEKPKGNYIALSNMDVSKITKAENTEIVSFKQSMPMAAYALGFILGEFQFRSTDVTPKIGDNFELRVYASKAQIHKTHFALNVAKQIVQFYVEYFNIAYPLPKLDMIALPDLASSGLGNWGLMLFQESALFYNDTISNTIDVQNIVTTIAHEFAQIWFGNLLTLDWWNDLWLIKGFATLMQYKATDAIHSKWQMMDQFLIDHVYPVMDLDATLASHPIGKRVSSPNQITEIFDRLSYSKGAALLRMLANMIGTSVFTECIQKYVQTYKYGNAKSIDLWNIIQSTHPQNYNVIETMDTWTTQTGYPVITVEDGNRTLYLIQRRFLPNSNSREQIKSSAYNYKYNIPMTMITDVAINTEIKFFFTKNDSVVTIPYPVNSTWIKLNHKGLGYYRVNYPENYWRTLFHNYQLMEVSDKANLIDDSFVLAKAGILNYTIPLGLRCTLTNERNYTIWSVTIRRLEELQTLLKPIDHIYNIYQKYVLQMIIGIYDELSRNEDIFEDHLDNLLRGKILNVACSFGMDDCLIKARKMFNAWFYWNQPIPPNLKEVVYSFGMRDISKDIWYKFFTEKYLKERDAQNKLQYFKGLASTRNMDLLKELLKKTEDPNIVRSQDFFTSLQCISANEAGTSLIWDYVRRNWEKLVERFTLNDRNLGQLLPTITNSFATTFQLDEIEAFFAKYPDTGAGQTSRNIALENVKNNIIWVERYSDEVYKLIEHINHLQNCQI